VIMPSPDPQLLTIPHLTLQPRTPRPLRHQRLPPTKAPPVLHHPKLRMQCCTSDREINWLL
jgi:hypothetical protein